MKPPLSLSKCLSTFESFHSICIKSCYSNKRPRQKMAPQNYKSKRESVETNDQETWKRPDLKTKEMWKESWLFQEETFDWCVLLSRDLMEMEGAQNWMASPLMSRGIWIQFGCLSPRHFHVAYMFSNKPQLWSSAVIPMLKPPSPPFAYFNKSCSCFFLPPHPMFTMPCHCHASAG